MIAEEPSLLGAVIRTTADFDVTDVTRSLGADGAVFRWKIAIAPSTPLSPPGWLALESAENPTPTHSV